MISEHFLCFYSDSDLSFSRQNNAAYLVFEKIICERKIPLQINKDNSGLQSDLYPARYEVCDFTH